MGSGTKFSTQIMKSKLQLIYSKSSTVKVGAPQQVVIVFTITYIESKEINLSFFLVFPKFNQL